MFLVWFLCLFSPSSIISSYYLPLSQEGTEPFLRLWDGRPLHWSTGQVASLIETSRAVRISLRGIHFYDRDVNPVSDGWSCRRSRSALCVLETTPNRILPTGFPPPRFSVGHHQPMPMGPVAARGCGSESSGRVIVFNDSIYDLSACDILAGGADVLWSDGILYLDADLPLPMWAYVVTAAVVFFLVVSLGQNIGQILGDKDAATQPWFTEILCFGQCVLLLVLTDPWRVWVAEHDREMLCLTVCYVALYLTRHAFTLVLEGHVYTLNVITATLVLVTARLYCSFETPYCTVFLLLLMSRLAHKLFALEGASGMERLTIVADAVYLSLHYRLSYRPSFWDPQANPPPHPHNTLVHLLTITTHRWHPCIYPPWWSPAWPWGQLPTPSRKGRIRAQRPSTWAQAPCPSSVRIEMRWQLGHTAVRHGSTPSASSSSTAESMLFSPRINTEAADGSSISAGLRVQWRHLIIVQVQKQADDVNGRRGG